MTKTILATFCSLAVAVTASAQPFAPAAPLPAPRRAPAPVQVPTPAPPALVAPPAPLTFAVDPSLWELDGVPAYAKPGIDRAMLEMQKGPRAPLPVPRLVKGRDDALYDQARSLIERDQYERALSVLDRVIGNKGPRVDAAMYWKAYSLSKLARRAEALAVLSDLQKQFPGGPWLRDARALEVEVRQASGQSVSPDSVDDDTKVLALRGLMQNEPESALPTIEKLLSGNSSVRVKDRALFLVSQSRAIRAREVLGNVATNGSNPELRLSAVRYLGMRSDPESQKVLNDIYTSTGDLDMKRSILRSFMTANARDRLMAVARGERSPDLRAVAVQQLGAIRGSTELDELYRAESDKAVKQRILQSMVAANATDKLARIARDEKDPDLQRNAVRYLGATNRPDAVDTLRAIYVSGASIDVKKAVIDALSIHQNCSPLVAMARAEKNKELQTEIVRRLSTTASRCAEARDYLVELLK
jgi:DNA-binding TFAR19-related protein (PDSD5 family)